MIPLRLLLTALALALAACIAPDGSTITVATVDEENRVQVQRVEVSAREEWHRGFFDFCLLATMDENGYTDVAGCHELTADAHSKGLYTDTLFIELFDWELVKAK